MPQDISTKTQPAGPDIDTVSGPPHLFAGHGEFAAIVQAHLPWVSAMARRQLGDASLAEDAAQVVFLSLWRSRRRLRRGMGVGGWLVRATQYACNDLRKTERRRKQRERKVAAMRSEDSPCPDGAAPESDAAMLIALDATMQKLAANDRDVLVARFFQNQSARQIAEQLRISDAAAEKRISRAIDRLRKRMVRSAARMDQVSLGALLIAGAGNAPSGLLENVLLSITGKVPVAPHIAHAARKLTWHLAHIPVAVAAVAAAAVIAVSASATLHSRQDLKNPSAVVQTTAKTAPARAISSASKTDVLTCVTYEMLVQRDFAWAVRTGGKLLSGKPGAVQTYDISARTVRALAGAMLGRKEVLLGHELHWMPTPAYSPPGNQLPLVRNYTLARSGSGGFANVDLLIGGPAVRSYASFARVQLHFNAGSTISASFGRKPTNILIPYVYRNTLDIRAGHAVVLLKKLCVFRGKKWYSAVVFDVERYPFHEVNTVGEISGIGRYIRVGPAGLKQLAKVATAWHRYAHAHPVKPMAIDAQWTKSLPGGAVVSLQGITTGTWPLCPWTPSGLPFSSFELPHSQLEYRRPGTAAGFLRLELPMAKVGAAQHFYPRQKTMSSFQWATFPAKAAAWSVGFDSGKWKIIGTAKPVPMQSKFNFSYKGDPLKVSASPAGVPGTVYFNVLCWGTKSDLSNQAIAVGALTRQGTLVGPRPWWPADYSGFHRFQTSRSAATGEYGYEAIPVAAADVKRYVWITRPRHWVTFRGFALRPTPLPSVVAQKYRAGLGRQKQKTKSNADHLAVSQAVMNQTTPAGLMLLMRHDAYEDIPENLQKLFYATTAFEKKAIATAAKQIPEQYVQRRFWKTAIQHVGLRQVREAGLTNMGWTPLLLPKQWRISGHYAVPVLPLPRGVSWPVRGQPMHTLIKRNGLWYVDFRLTRDQATQVKMGLKQMQQHRTPRIVLAEQAVLKLLRAGKIKDAYALRDDLDAALKKYTKPAR